MSLKGGKERNNSEFVCLGAEDKDEEKVSERNAERRRCEVFVILRDGLVGLVVLHKDAATEGREEGREGGGVLGHCCTFKY